MISLEEVKRRFPQYKVTQRPFADFINTIIIFYKEGNKYKDNGLENPDYIWHEWGFLVDTDETKIDRRAFSDSLDDLEIQIRQQIDYYHSPEYGVTRKEVSI